MFLNKNLQNTHKENIKHFKKEVEYPRYHNCIIKPFEKKRGVFAAYQMSPNGYVLFIVDYAIFFFIDNEMQIAFKACSNKWNDIITIFLTDTQNWVDLNILSVNKMLKNKIEKQ